MKNFHRELLGKTRYRTLKGENFLCLVS